MSLGNLVGQILQDGLGRQRETRARVDTSARRLESAGGLESVFNQLSSAAGGRGGTSGGLSGLAEAARTFAGKKQAGGLTGAQIGGIGAAAGALLGGGKRGGGMLGGAAKGGALAILGTLAIGALRDAQAQNAAQGASQGAAALPPASDTITREEVRSLTGPDAERLVLRAMISAANADGRIDPQEMTAILGKLDDETVTEAERREVMAEMVKPLTAAELAAEVRTPAQAAEVYAAALLAINVDTEAERGYLRELARELKLDEATVRHLHDMTGAPAA